MNDDHTKPMFELNDIQKRVLQETLRKLAALPVKYAIVLPSGEKLGTLDIVVENPNKRTIHRTGVKYKPFYEKILSELAVNDTAEVFLPEDAPEGAKLESLQSAICGYCSSAWGNSTYTTMIDKKRRCVSVLRYEAVK